MKVTIVVEIEGNNLDAVIRAIQRNFDRLREMKEGERRRVLNNNDVPIGTLEVENNGEPVCVDAYDE